MDWIIGALIAVALAIGGILGGTVMRGVGRREGRADARKDQQLKEAQHARTIEAKADAARAAGGDVDERLHRHGAYRD